MECLRLLVDAQKARRLRVPEDPLGFLVYSVGSNYLQITVASRDRPQNLSQDRRVDASAVRVSGRRHDTRATEPENAQPCILLLLGIGQPSVQVDRRARDEAIEFGSCAGSTGSAGERMRLLGPPPETRNG